MAVKKTQNRSKSYQFTLREKRWQVTLDKVLIWRLFRNLHGRFWGVAAVLGMLTGLSICLLIKPELITISTAYSDFGRDVRTAPVFSGSMFFAAYGFWRWRNYLARTLKRTRPVLGLVSCTIIGLYLVALMPVSWQPWPYRLHFFGVFLAGGSMAATVIVDILLSKTRRGANASSIRAGKLLSFLMIITGGYLLYGSADVVQWFHVALLGETLMLVGYTIWIVMKTWQGEGNRSALSRVLHKIVLVD